MMGEALTPEEEAMLAELTGKHKVAQEAKVKAAQGPPATPEGVKAAEAGQKPPTGNEIASGVGNRLDKINQSLAGKVPADQLNTFTAQLKQQADQKLQAAGLQPKPAAKAA